MKAHPLITLFLLAAWTLLCIIAGASWQAWLERRTRKEITSLPANRPRCWMDGRKL